MLAEQIRRAREAVGESQAALAERAGVSRATVARIELGQRVASVSVGSVLRALGLPASLAIEAPGIPETERQQLRELAGA